MVRIAIIDDNREFAEALKERVERNIDWCRKQIDIYQEPRLFLYELEDGAGCDICFSDVVMPDMNGIELARKVRAFEPSMYLIFLSSYVTYAIDGYDVDAYAYILKSQLNVKWGSLMVRLRKDIEDSVKKIYIVETNSRIEKIPVQRIMYVYKEDKNCNIVTDDRLIPVRKTLRTIAEELEQYESFIKVERGYIINIERMKRLKVKMIEMENGKEIPIGRMFEKEVRETLHKHWRKNG